MDILSAKNKEEMMVALHNTCQATKGYERNFYSLLHDSLNWTRHMDNPFRDIVKEVLEGKYSKLFSLRMRLMRAGFKTSPT